MHHSINSWLSHLRLIQYVPLLLLAMMGVACTLNPGDGSQIGYASDSVTFSGYSSVAGGVVTLEAQNSSGVWSEIGRVNAGTTNYNTTGTTALYPYTLSKAVPKAYWRAEGGVYKTTLRMRSNNSSTYTFTAAGQQCVVDTFYGGTLTDLVAIGQKCTTGSTLGLIATSVSRYTPSESGGAGGWLCAGVGSGCVWKARLDSKVLGLSGCSPNYQLDVEVTNLGEVASDEYVASSLSTTGDAWNATCHLDDTGRMGCLLHSTTPFNFGYSNNVSTKVKLAPGQKTILHVAIPVATPTFANSVTAEGRSGLSSRRWSWNRGSWPTRDNPFPSQVCFSDWVGGA